MIFTAKRATILGRAVARSQWFSSEVEPASPLFKALDYQEALKYLQAKDYKNSLVHLFRTRDILDHAQQQGSLEYYHVSNKCCH
jgi:hypothetical protein